MQNTTFWLRVVAGDARTAGIRPSIGQSELQLGARKSAFAAVGRRWMGEQSVKSRSATMPRSDSFETELKIERYLIATALGGDAIPPSTLSGHETSMKSYWRS
jgi:hypothetical protein